jgi:hypothetical protein
MPEQPEQLEQPERMEQPEQVLSESGESADAPEAQVEAPESGESTDAPRRVLVADDVLLDSVDLARRALLDVTPAETVGSVLGHVVEDEHVLTLLFAADLSGYPGWHWSATIARVDDGEPTVLETELMPGEAALLAPDWVPWSERLADYRAAQEAVAAAAAALAEDEAREGSLVDDDFDDEDLDDEDAEDDADLDDEAELDAAFGHDSGDDEFDGIDIDALDDSGDDTDDEDDDEDDEDDRDEVDDRDDEDENRNGAES